MPRSTKRLTQRIVTNSIILRNLQCSSFMSLCQYLLQDHNDGLRFGHKHLTWNILRKVVPRPAQFLLYEFHSVLFRLLWTLSVAMKITTTINHLVVFIR